MKFIDFLNVSSCYDLFVCVYDETKKYYIEIEDTMECLFKDTYNDYKVVRIKPIIIHNGNSKHNNILQVECGIKVYLKNSEV